MYDNSFCSSTCSKLLYIGRSRIGFVRKRGEICAGTEKNVARRGDFFLSADVTIRNEGNGNIGAAAHAYLNKPATELYVSLYLDRYDESLKKWKQVDYVDFVYTLEEYPDGIEDPAIDVTFTNQKRGYYYRIRGAFTAGDEEKVEGFGPTTDGIWID